MAAADPDGITDEGRASAVGPIIAVVVALLVVAAIAVVAALIAEDDEGSARPFHRCAPCQSGQPQGAAPHRGQPAA